jgi:hypothetical protein
VIALYVGDERVGNLRAKASGDEVRLIFIDDEEVDFFSTGSAMNDSLTLASTVMTLQLTRRRARVNVDESTRSADAEELLLRLAARHQIGDLNYKQTVDRNADMMGKTLTLSWDAIQLDVSQWELLFDHDQVDVL